MTAEWGSSDGVDAGTAEMALAEFEVTLATAEVEVTLATAEAEVEALTTAEQDS